MFKKELYNWEIIAQVSVYVIIPTGQRRAIFIYLAAYSGGATGGVGYPSHGIAIRMLSSLYNIINILKIVYRY